MGQDITEAGIVQVRDICHDMELLHALQGLDAEGGEAFSRVIAGADAVLPVPGQGDHLDAVRAHIIQDGEAILERRGILDREHCGNTSIREGVLHLPAIQNLADLWSVLLELFPEIGCDLSVELVRLESCL